jgi:hypothetical protein
MGHLTDQQGDISGWQDVYQSAERVLRSVRLRLGYDNSIVALAREPSILSSYDLNFTFCTGDLETWAIERMRHGVNSDYERSADTEDANRLRDPGANAGRVHAESQEDRETAREEVTAPAKPPEEVASRTAPARQSDGCTAKRTRSGSPEDA